MTSSAYKMAVGMLSSVLLTAVSAEADTSKGYAVGRCHVQQKDLPVALSPVYSASSYINNFQRDSPVFKLINLEAFDREAKATLLGRPKLGVIEGVTGEVGALWQYKPKKFDKDGSYAGRDNFVAKVEYKGIVIFIHYYIEVIGNDPKSYIGEDQETHGYFCNPGALKISQAASATTEVVSDELRGSSAGPRDQAFNLNPRPSTSPNQGSST